MAESEQFNFPSEEEKVLNFWKQIDAFQSCLRQSKDKPRSVSHATVVSDGLLYK